jgi:hypothetical protein
MARPKGSKNRNKENVIEAVQTEKRPRGRPRKIPTELVEVKEKRPRGRPRKNQINSKVQPNTNLEEFPEKSISKNSLPEIEEDYSSVMDSYSTTRWTSDDWSGSNFDNFSIGSDYMY